MALNDISVSLKTNNIKDKDENLVLNFEGGSVISTGGNIKITQDGKTIEEIAIGGGKTSGGVYHSNSMVWDYEYNWIGLVNDDIFKHLAALPLNFEAYFSGLFLRLILSFKGPTKISLKNKPQK